MEVVSPQKLGNDKWKVLLKKTAKYKLENINLLGSLLCHSLERERNLMLPNAEHIANKETRIIYSKLKKGKPALMMQNVQVYNVGPISK